MNKNLIKRKNKYMENKEIENKNIKIIISGLIIGVLSGLFSSGGGIIAVIIFNRILKLDEKDSRAMAVCCILPMVLTSLFFYNRGNYIDWKLGMYCGIGGIIGGTIGSIMLQKINDKYLQLIFIVFLIYSAISIIK